MRVPSRGVESRGGDHQRIDLTGVETAEPRVELPCSGTMRQVAAGGAGRIGAARTCRCPRSGRPARSPEFRFLTSSPTASRGSALSGRPRSRARALLRAGCPWRCGPRRRFGPALSHLRSRDEDCFARDGVDGCVSPSVTIRSTSTSWPAERRRRANPSRSAPEPASIHVCRAGSSSACPSQAMYSPS